jgi:hypothetical protein
LLACLKNVGECFRIAATLLEGQARSAQVQVDFREGKSTTYNSHQLGATPNQVLQWQELSVSAYAEVAKIDKFWLTLKRGGRQVVMLSETTMAKADTIRRRQKGGRQVVMNSQATMAKADTISRRQKGGHGPLSQH